jgi:hypothetical protein
MVLLDEAADAVNSSVKPNRADLIQTTQHCSPATPSVRGGIAFFVERLIDKPIRISPDDVNLAARFGHGYFATCMRKGGAVMPTALTLQRWRLGPTGSDSMLLSKHRHGAKEKSD